MLAPQGTVFKAVLTCCSRRLHGKQPCKERESRLELFKFVSNERAFELMGGFMEKEGVAVSRELAGLTSLIAVAQRELEASQRAYWPLSVQIQGEVSTATNDVCDFLIDQMKLQRSLGRFDFFLDARGMVDWLERLRTCVAAEGRI